MGPEQDARDRGVDHGEHEISDPSGAYPVGRHRAAKHCQQAVVDRASGEDPRAEERKVGGFQDDNAACSSLRSRRVRKSWALTATMTVDRLMASAPTAIGRSIPQGTKTPAATGIASTL